MAGRTPFYSARARFSGRPAVWVFKRAGASSICAATSAYGRSRSWYALSVLRLGCTALACRCRWQRESAGPSTAASNTKQRLFQVSGA